MQKKYKSLSYAYKFTGNLPVFNLCPGVRSDGSITSLPHLRLDSSREDILNYFHNSWALTEVLFSGLANEAAFYRQPYHRLRHPLIFYYGHPVALYINKLRVAGLIDKPLNAEFEALFEAGVDEMRWDDLHEGNQDIWPSIEAVRNYRKQAYDLISTLITTHPFLESDHMPINQKSPMWALVMGFEHERIHLETSSVLMRELPIECVRKPDAWPDSMLGNTEMLSQNALITLPKTIVSLGKPDDFPNFGWDNEYGSETRTVRPFSASKQLISNGEFLEFVKAGGYTEEKYWSREGSSWRRFRNVKWPTFWVQDGPAGSHLFKLRTIFEIIDMPMDYPAIVNFHEAKAYCAWKSEQDGGMPYRLLTEAEHNALRDGKESGMNSNLISGSESSVNSLAANSKGFHDVFGNVWQWCEDHFHPLAGAKPHPYYDDFSTPCYDGEHQMILGGSFISTGDEASRFARFHFRPHFFQHAGFRIARSEDGNAGGDPVILGENEYNANVASHSSAFQSWSETGWLNSDSYYSFWGKILACDLQSHLENKHVVDVGAGNAKIWQAAFAHGLKLKKLTLIDPNLSVDTQFLEQHNISALSVPFEHALLPASTDVVFFKQSLHLLYGSLKERLFPHLCGKKLISFAMPYFIEWPMSENLSAKYRSSWINMKEVMKIGNFQSSFNNEYAFRVNMPRNDWVQMIRNKFFSTLHNTNQRFIEQEIEWIEAHLPEQLSYEDRLECSIFEIKQPSSTYETQEMLNKYLLMHWASEQEIWSEVPPVSRPDVIRLPLKCAELVTKYANGFESALDLGCAVGRSTFEMARHFKEVAGIDYSREFIDSTNALQASGKRVYWRKDSGAEGVSLVATVDQAIDRSRVRFEQGDACALPLHLKHFDAVLMANVLCRLPDPAACLERMQGANALVKRGGVLVMTTPFSWLEEYTPKSQWVEGIEGVKKLLTEFELIHQEELPFFIREHRRRFEYIITMASVWRRK